MNDLLIVDNGDKNWRAKNYLHEWADHGHTFDSATGYFEISALLALDGQWQELDKPRILTGDDVSKRTKEALLKGVKSALNQSIERTREKNDFFSGMPAIAETIRERQIECKVYDPTLEPFTVMENELAGMLRAHARELVAAGQAGGVSESPAIWRTNG